MKPDKENFDAIIIGSGIGGLPGIEKTAVDFHNNTAPKDWMKGSKKMVVIKILFFLLIKNDEKIPKNTIGENQKIPNSLPKSIKKLFLIFSLIKVNILSLRK